jgi:hypothetical protein
MKKSKFTEEQIAFALKQAEGGTSVEGVCRTMGIPKPRSMPDARNPVVRAYRSCTGFGNSRKTTASSNSSSRT